MKGLSEALIYAVIIAAVIVAAFAVVPQQRIDDQATLKKFSSPQELENFLASQRESGYYYGGFGEAQALSAGADVAAAPAVAQAEKAVDYSSTNIQVAGVDEADIVKNDGRYIYTVSGDSVVILDAFPPEGLGIVSTINLSGSNPQEIYVNGDRLVVFGNIYDYGLVSYDVVAQKEIAEPAESIASPLPQRFSQPATYIKIYDISDRANPVISNDILLNGTYYESRMIGGHVYAIATTQPYYISGRFVVPAFSPDQMEFPDIYYFDVPDYSYQFTNIVSVNIMNGDMNNKVFLLGYSTSMYVSEDNIYLTYQKRVSPGYIFDRVLDEIILPAAPAEVDEEINSIRNSDKPYYEKQNEIGLVIEEWFDGIGPEEAASLQKSFEEKYGKIQADMQKEMDKSVIHKIAIGNGGIDYRTKGEVPGSPLNQFSMDEHNGYFRIATTTRGFFSGPQPLIAPERQSTLNHLYVLDENMNVVGKLEDLAPGESIFSARFIGDRAYLVTFVRIDPLFVIDLSDPTQPKVLGELKIPGVSDYLHPYDENHIIGVGRATDDLGNRVTFSGIKVSLFDVSDVANPVELSSYEIGDRGTSSEVLYDHKAFLFSKEKNLMVLPVMVYESKPGEFYGSPVFQGAYVFDVTLNGFDLKGRVTHADNLTDGDQYYYYGPYSISRSLYMDDYLYTISEKAVKANSLADLAEISRAELPGYERYYGILGRPTAVAETSSGMAVPGTSTPDMVVEEA